MTLTRGKKHTTPKNKLDIQQLQKSYSQIVMSRTMMGIQEIYKYRLGTCTTSIYFMWGGQKVLGEPMVYRRLKVVYGVTMVCET
jgi:hypothetical protein